MDFYENDIKIRAKASPIPYLYRLQIESIPCLPLAPTQPPPVATKNANVRSEKIVYAGIQGNAGHLFRRIESCYSGPSDFIIKAQTEKHDLPIQRHATTPYTMITRAVAISLLHSVKPQ